MVVSHAIVFDRVMALRIGAGNTAGKKDFSGNATCPYHRPLDRLTVVPVSHYALKVKDIFRRGNVTAPSHDRYRDRSSEKLARW
jgi:hypothetical protein